MNGNEHPQSGFIGNPDIEFQTDSAMHDVEIIRITQRNVVARGRRYGRMWLLKGLNHELSKSASARRQMQKEFELHSRLHHPLIAQAVGIEWVDGIGQCMVREWVDGPTLSEALRSGSMTKTERRRAMREIVNAVAYMHSQGVVHRDLKPDNIVLRRAGGDAVIIDFGLADTDDYVELKQPAGTPGYISPEQSETGGAKTSDDVYSLGVIMRELCPDYRRIAGRCTGQLAGRPADARALGRLIDRRERRPKIIMATAAAILAITLGSLALIRINDLSRATHDAESRVETLTAESRNSANQVSTLTDSLTDVHNRLKAAELQLERVESMKQTVAQALREGERRIDDVLTRYDREVFSQFTPDNHQNFTDGVLQLQRDLGQQLDDYSKSPAMMMLPASERRAVMLELQNYSAITLARYHKNWTKKIYPQMQQYENF